MQSKIRLLTLSIVFFCGGLASSFAIPPSSQSSILIQMTFPKEAIDMSDLDVRDHLNQPVNSTSKRKALERLFTQSLNRLLLFNITPAKQAMWELMSKSLTGMAGWITKTFYNQIDSVTLWFSSKKWKEVILTSNHLKMKWGGTDPEHHFINNPRSSFQFLVGNIISSTQLLR